MFIRQRRLAFENCPDDFSKGVRVLKVSRRKQRGGGGGRRLSGYTSKFWFTEANKCLPLLVGRAEHCPAFWASARGETLRVTVQKMVETRYLP
jgi:hypothetical protein